MFLSHKNKINYWQALLVASKAPHAKKIAGLSDHRENTSARPSVRHDI
jgi:hypothetical protein